MTYRSEESRIIPVNKKEDTYDHEGYSNEDGHAAYNIHYLNVTSKDEININYDNLFKGLKHNNIRLPSESDNTHFHHKCLDNISFIDSTFESIQEYVKIRNKLKEEGVDVIFTNCKEHDEYEQYISLTKRSVIYLTLISLAASAIAGITAGAVTAELDTALITAVFALATCAIASLVYYFKAGQEYPCSKASNLAESRVQSEQNITTQDYTTSNTLYTLDNLQEPLMSGRQSSQQGSGQESGPKGKT